VWTFAGAGMLVKIAWPMSPRWLGVVLYMIVGWLALIPAYEVASRLGAWQSFLLIFGGALYSVGGIIYALKRPDPLPKVFGFHEVFHTFVIAGSVVHFLLIAVYVL
jgi:hemolysin III